MGFYNLNKEVCKREREREMLEEISSHSIYSVLTSDFVISVFRNPSCHFSPHPSAAALILNEHLLLFSKFIPSGLSSEFAHG